MIIGAADWMDWSGGLFAVKMKVCRYGWKKFQNIDIFPISLHNRWFSKRQVQ